MAAMNSFISRRPQERGAVLVELSLVLPILLLLTLATVEFAQAMAAYKVVVLQVRLATRYLSAKAPGTGHAEARCLLTHGVASPVCSGAALMPGLVANGFSVSVSDALNTPATQRAQRTSSDSTVVSATTINLVTVTASGYRYPLNFAGFLTGITGGAATFDFAPISMTMRQTQ